MCLFAFKNVLIYAQNCAQKTLAVYVENVLIYVQICAYLRSNLCLFTFKFVLKYKLKCLSYAVLQHL